MITTLLWLFADVALRTWKKTFRRPVTLVFSLVQPMMWMAFFGFLMTKSAIDLPNGVTYSSFLLPGICGMTVLFGASQAGVSLIREIQSGFLQRMLATPAPHWILHTGKTAADSIRLLGQAIIIILLGLLVGASIKLSLLPYIVSFFGLFLFAVGFCSLSCAIALRAKRPETMGTFVHVVNMPVFFTSTALVPHKQMPDWLASIAQWNPLTLAVESLRDAMLFGVTSALTTHLLALLFFAVVFTFLAIFELRKGALIHTWDVK